jgi:hypothetical protein
MPPVPVKELADFRATGFISGAGLPFSKMAIRSFTDLGAPVVTVLLAVREAAIVGV